MVVSNMQLGLLPVVMREKKFVDALWFGYLFARRAIYGGLTTVILV